MRLPRDLDFDDDDDEEDDNDSNDDFYIQVIEALADGAVMMGLPRALATEQVATNKQIQTDKKLENRVCLLLLTPFRQQQWWREPQEWFW